MAFIFAAAPTPKFFKDEIKFILRQHYGIRLELIKEATLGSCTAFIGECEEKSEEIARKIHDEASQANLGFDLMYFPENSIPNLKKPGAVVLDMDMTSVQIEGIDEIARHLGVYNEVAEITARAMAGEYDFATSLRKRVSILEGGDVSIFKDIKRTMPETDGLSELMHVATAAGWKKGICSGGFIELICALEDKYKLDMVKANSLEIAGDKLTGRAKEPIVDAKAKRTGVLELLNANKIPKEQCVVLGDGANDLLMIEEAGLGIAYHAKPIVREKAPYALNYSSLIAVPLLLKLYA